MCEPLAAIPKASGIRPQGDIMKAYNELVDDSNRPH